MLDPVINIRNTRQEVFFMVTKKGALYRNRPDDYHWRDVKSPYNVMHESMVRDVALSFYRNYPDFDIKVSFNEVFGKVKPDITVRMSKGDINYVFLVEVERKKTADRLLDKVAVYEKMFKELDFGKSNLPKQVKVLILYANLQYDAYLRPLEYSKHQEKINLMDKQLNNIITKIPDRYRLTTFNNFYRIHEAVWYNNKVELNKIVH